MGKKQAWVSVPMTDDEVKEWLRVRDKGFARFAFRYGAVIVGALCVVLLVLHFVVNAIDGIPENLRMFPLRLLFGLPVLGPVIVCVVCGMTWSLHADKYRNTVRQQDEDSSTTEPCDEPEPQWRSGRA